MASELNLERAWSRHTKCLVYVFPVCSIPPKAFNAFVRKLHSFSVRRITQLTKPSGYASELCPFPSFSWTDPTKAIAFHFEPIDPSNISQLYDRHASHLDSVHVSHRALGIIGIASHGIAPQFTLIHLIEKQFLQFIHQLPNFSQFIFQKCFVLGNCEKNIPNSNAKSDLIFFPCDLTTEDASLFDTHLSIALDTLALTVIMSIKSIVRAVLSNIAHTSLGKFSFLSSDDVFNRKRSAVSPSTALAAAFSPSSVVSAAASVLSNRNSNYISKERAQTPQIALFDTELHVFPIDASSHSTSPLQKSSWRLNIARLNKLIGDFAMLIGCVSDAKSHLFAALEHLREQEKQTMNGDSTALSSSDAFWLGAALESVAICCYIENHTFSAQILELCNESVFFYAKAGAIAMEIGLLERLGAYVRECGKVLAADQIHERLWLRRILLEVWKRGYAVFPALCNGSRVRYLLCMSENLQSVGYIRCAVRAVFEAASVILEEVLENKGLAALVLEKLYALERLTVDQCFLSVRFRIVLVLCQLSEKLEEYERWSRDHLRLFEILVSCQISIAESHVLYRADSGLIEEESASLSGVSGLGDGVSSVAMRDSHLLTLPRSDSERQTLAIQFLQTRLQPAIEHGETVRFNLESLQLFDARTSVLYAAPANVVVSLSLTQIRHLPLIPNWNSHIPFLRRSPQKRSSMCEESRADTEELEFKSAWELQSVRCIQRLQRQALYEIERRASQCNAYFRRQIDAIEFFVRILCAVPNFEPLKRNPIFRKTHALRIRAQEPISEALFFFSPFSETNGRKKEAELGSQLDLELRARNALREMEATHVCPVFLAHRMIQIEFLMTNALSVPVLLRKASVWAYFDSDCETNHVHMRSVNVEYFESDVILARNERNCACVLRIRPLHAGKLRIYGIRCEISNVSVYLKLESELDYNILEVLEALSRVCVRWESRETCASTIRETETSLWLYEQEIQDCTLELENIGSRCITLWQLSVEIASADSEKEFVVCRSDAMHESSAMIESETLGLEICMAQRESLRWESRERILFRVRVRHLRGKRKNNGQSHLPKTCAKIGMIWRLRATTDASLTDNTYFEESRCCLAVHLIPSLSLRSACIRQPKRWGNRELMSSTPYFAVQLQVYNPTESPFLLRVETEESVIEIEIARQCVRNVLLQVSMSCLLQKLCLKDLKESVCAALDLLVKLSWRTYFGAVGALRLEYNAFPQSLKKLEMILSASQSSMELSCSAERYVWDEKEIGEDNGDVLTRFAHVESWRDWEEKHYRTERFQRLLLKAKLDVSEKIVGKLEFSFVVYEHRAESEDLLLCECLNHFIVSGKTSFVTNGHETLEMQLIFLTHGEYRICGRLVCIPSVDALDSESTRSVGSDIWTADPLYIHVIR